MPQSGAVTGWLNELRVGDEDAARNLWDEYFRRMVGLANKRLHGRQRGPAEPENVALSAFDTFCRGVESGRFENLNNRDDLWQVLVMVTARKATDALRREYAAKRNPGNGATEEPNLHELISREPTASFMSSMDEEFRRLLDLLNDATLQAIALARFEGYSNLDIANRLECKTKTIERKLKLIRRIWKESGANA